MWRSRKQSMQLFSIRDSLERNLGAVYTHPSNLLFLGGGTHLSMTQKAATKWRFLAFESSSIPIGIFLSEGRGGCPTLGTRLVTPHVHAQSLVHGILLSFMDGSHLRCIQKYSNLIDWFMTSSAHHNHHLMTSCTIRFVHLFKLSHYGTHMCSLTIVQILSQTTGTFQKDTPPCLP